MNYVPPGKFSEDDEMSATYLIQAGEHTTMFLACVVTNLLNKALLYSFKHTKRVIKVLNWLNKYISPMKISIEILWTVYYDICLGFFL